MSENKRKGFFDDDDDVVIENLAVDDGPPDEIECSPMLIAVLALCIGVVTFFLGIVSTARVEYVQLQNQCVDPLLSGWLADGLLPTPVSALLPFNSTTNGLSVNSLSVKPSSLPYRNMNGVKLFYLFAQPVQQDIYDIKDFQPNIGRYVGSNFDTAADVTHPLANDNYTIFQWGYNGQFPGPVIEVNQGDKIRIVLKNELPEPTTLHLHGIIQDWENDGTGGVNEMPIAIGQSRTYELTVTQCGTFMYGPGYQTWRQQLRQMNGMFVVHCPQEDVVDRDYSVVASGFTVLNDHDSRNCPVWWRSSYDWYFLNGRVAPSVPALKARANERVRIRFLNPYLLHSPTIYLHGHQWTVSQIDGNLIPSSNRVSSSSVSLAAGVTVDVVFQARAGVWQLQSTASEQGVNFLPVAALTPNELLHHGGMSTLLCVEGVTPRNTTVVCF